MSIICTKVEDSPHLKTELRRGIGEYVWATIDPSTVHQLPFSSDYKYFSCFLPRKYALWADRIQHFNVRPDDIWTLGFGKTGKLIYKHQMIEFILNDESLYSISFQG